MDSQPHFVLIPFMAQGHLIPMMDIAKLLAQRNVIVSIVTTPLNAAKFKTGINRAIESGLPIRVFELRFPATEAGLPEGCESADVLPSLSLIRNFINAVFMLQQPIEQLFEELKPRPSCVIHDTNLPWTAAIASKFRIPRILFDGQSCFSRLCNYNIKISNVYETVSDKSEAFVVPGMPDRIEFTRAQLPGMFNPPGVLSDMKDIRDHMREAEKGALGVLINSFEELEIEYVKEYRKAKGDKVWCVGPVSLSNAEDIDKAQRGNISSTDENHCLKWLNSWPPSSVIYACLGSLSRINLPQMIELGISLEASNRPFIWVIRGGYNEEQIKQWIAEDGFEERVKGRGLMIQGWAPQVLILSHPAIGGFLTHCGWNSTLEGICAGLPMITWPRFSDQFYNEKVIVQVLDIGVRVGAESVVYIGEEEKVGVSVKKEKIGEAIEKVMSQGNEGEERRKRARKLAELAKRAIEEGGSSYLNISLLIEDIIKQAGDYQIKA